VIETHIRWAAWLRIIWSVLGLLFILLGLVAFRSMGMPWVREITRSAVQSAGFADTPADSVPDGSVDDQAETVMRWMSVAFLVMALFELPGLATGWALLSYRPWSRPLNITISIFDLLNIPFGTALGAYSLWVMFRPETAELFTPGSPPGRRPALL